jgi:aryl-alcohol dehydrogenase-like predicted oxidoreductase
LRRASTSTRRDLNLEAPFEARLAACPDRPEEHMLRNRLGSSDLEITAVGLGTAPIGSHPSWSINWGRQDEREAVRTIHAALDAGVNWIDTAPFYGWGRAETLVGTALRHRRDDVLVFTKCGTMNDGSGGDFMDLSPSAIRGDVEGSLRRLGVGRIDLLQLHDPDPSVPIEASWGTVQELVSEGLVRHAGVSNHPVPLIERALAVGPVVASQNRYNVLARDIERDVLPFCTDADIGVLSWSSLAEGLLADAFDRDRLEPDDFRRRAPLFQDPAYGRARGLVGRLSTLAGEAGRTTAQLCLTWLVSRGVSGAIVGARTANEAVELAEAGARAAEPHVIERMNELLDAFS